MSSSNAELNSSKPAATSSTLTQETPASDASESVRSQPAKTAATTITIEGLVTTMAVHCQWVDRDRGSIGVETMATASTRINAGSAQKLVKNVALINKGVTASS